MGTAIDALPSKQGLLDRCVAWLIALALTSIYILPSQSASSFATYLLLVVLIASLVSSRPMRPFELPTWALMIVLLVAYLCASSLWSTSATARDVFSIMVRAVLVLTCVLAVARSQLRVPAFMTWLERGICAAAVVAAVVAMADFYLFPTWDDRLWGLGQLDNSVTAALGFAGAAIVAVSLADRMKGFESCAALIAACVLIVTVALTGSRSGYLALVMGAAMLVATRGRGRAAVWVAVAMVGSLLVAGVAFLFSPDAIIGALLPRGTSLRPEIWAAQIESLRSDGIWFGRGILSDDEVMAAGLTIAHPHSLFLSIAVQGGLLGLTLFMAVIVLGGARLWRARATVEARLGLGLLAGGVGGHLFDGHELIDKVGLSWLFFWLPLGLALTFRHSRQANSVGGVRS